MRVRENKDSILRYRSNADGLQGHCKECHRVLVNNSYHARRAEQTCPRVVAVRDVHGVRLTIYAREGTIEREFVLPARRALFLGSDLVALTTEQIFKANVSDVPPRVQKSHKLQLELPTQGNIAVTPHTGESGAD
jgi:hypothetical protein